MKQIRNIIIIYNLALAILFSVFYYAILPSQNIFRIINCTDRGFRLSQFIGDSNILLKLHFPNFKIPFSASLCDCHLRGHRGNKKDIDDLNSSYGAYEVARRSHKNTVKNLEFLISKGLDVNAIHVTKLPNNRHIKDTSLFLSVFEDEFDAVEILLNHGADPSIKGPGGLTPLEAAIKFKKNRYTIGLLEKAEAQQKRD